MGLASILGGAGGGGFSSDPSSTATAGPSSGTLNNNASFVVGDGSTAGGQAVTPAGGALSGVNWTQLAIVGGVLILGIVAIKALK